MVERMNFSQFVFKSKLILTVVALLGLTVNANEHTTIYLDHFKTQEFDKEGEPALLFEGDHARIELKTVHLKKSKTTLFHEEGKTVIEAGQSKFLQEPRIWSSREEVTVIGDTMKIEGVGFTMNIQKQQIKILDQVKVTIKTALFPKKESTPK